ncbi:hypothetical protein [Dysgonomonas macrotermitis]|uniref:Cleaved Adhesin Domain n=1 Tax=Dysgonomonas macrotermitis TaxID=1346286 RepID=A0A1M4ZKN6_9BACT|nr:hypothetical protein [Dysgonomonas macrotermitis]SHF18382.1 hypothetical protein SAMN05444362_104112 [Dysgonomonas macrotermitis]
MKKKILLLMGIFSSGIICSQVGINTQNPLGVFHVDPLANTNVTGTNGYEDDVIVTSTGNVGIGTVTPTAKLDVRGSVRIADGTQAEGKIFTTAGTGLGYWAETFKFQIIESSVYDGLLLPGGNGAAWLAVTPEVELTAGKWMLMARLVTKNACASTYFTWLRLLDASTGNAINAAGGRPSYDGAYYDIVETVGVIDITSGTKKVVLQGQNWSNCTYTSPDLGGSYLYAIKLS